MRFRPLASQIDQHQMHAVLDVSFQLAAGTSSCFNFLKGQLCPDAGRVFLDGRDITGVDTGKNLVAAGGADISGGGG
ncbi:MAG: hypothetical protein EXR09_01805 [Acetobacteraceae bacterium]|nr:hypothetical protein [Acetobacteraceae bacterium]